MICYYHNSGGQVELLYFEADFSLDMPSFYIIEKLTLLYWPMSIIIKANELNTLIYKYLLQTGLSHTAYTLFNEAGLLEPLKQFKFDLKAGHLLSLLQKALIFSQIQSHISHVLNNKSQSQYVECCEPFFLLKSHICKITEKIRQSKEETMKELVQQISDGIKRTNSIYHTQIANKELDQIVYEAKGTNYFDKFTKVRLPSNADSVPADDLNKFVLEGTSSQRIAVYHYDDNSVSLLKCNQSTDELGIQKLLPCVSQGEFAKMVCFAVTSNHIVQVYPNNFVTIMPTRGQIIEPVQFKSSMVRQVTKIQVNKNLEQLICFSSEDGFEVINLKSMRHLCRGEGRLAWKCFDQCIIVDDKKELSLRRLSKIDERILAFNTQGLSSDITQLHIDDIQISQAQTYFSITSFAEKTTYVYTFEKSEPLYKFTFQEAKYLKQTLWTVCKDVEYLAFLTNSQIKIWEMDLNAYSRILQISDYDSDVQKVLPAGQDDRVYLLGLGSQHLMVYDISNGQVERVQINGNVMQMKQIGLEKVALITQSYLYIINSSHLEPIFK